MKAKTEKAQINKSKAEFCTEREFSNNFLKSHAEFKMKAPTKGMSLMNDQQSPIFKIQAWNLCNDDFIYSFLSV